MTTLNEKLEKLQALTSNETLLQIAAFAKNANGCDIMNWHTANWNTLSNVRGHERTKKLAEFGQYRCGGVIRKIMPEKAIELLIRRGVIKAN